MTAYDQNPWTLPAHLFDSIELAEKEIQSPTPENTAAVIPRLGRNGDTPTIEDFAGCGRGLIVCTDGPGKPLAFRNSWPDVVEVVFPHGPFGAAHARNVGLGVAASRRAEWAWLIDSDCSSPGTTGDDGVSCLSELFAAWRPGCAAIQGSVIFDGGGSPGEHGEIAALLEALELFNPPQDSQGPQAIVTAHVLVHIPTVLSIGGFDIDFPDAGGEDIDLGVRLRRAGHLIALAPRAIVHHEAMSLKGLLDRKQRYGRGMRRFAEKHGVTETLAPIRDGPSWNDHGKIGDLMLTN